MNVPEHADFDGHDWIAPDEFTYRQSGEMLVKSAFFSGDFEGESLDYILRALRSAIVESRRRSGVERFFWMGDK